MSTTTNLKLFKHDNPTTNTNQFDVEKALNENWDKIDKNVGEMASKIQILENTTSEKDTSLESEIKALKEENAMFRSQIPSATVIGKSIRLTDSSNMPCQIIPLGASIQEGIPSIESEAPIKSVGDNGSIEIYNRNKNLLNINDSCLVYGSKTTVSTKNNEITAINSNEIANGCIMWVLEVELNKDITISYSNMNTLTGSTNSSVKYGFYDEKPTSISSTSIGTVVSNTDKKLTVNSASKYLGIIIRLGNGDTVTVKDLMTEYGSTATDYIEHQSQTRALHTQQPFRAIEDIKDRFVKKDGVWYEERKIERYIFTGNESDVSLRGTYNGVNVFQILEPFNYKLEYSAIANAKSNYCECQKTLSYVADVTVVAGIQLYYNSGNTSRALYINTDKFTTVEELKAWLSEQYTNGTPLYVDYILAEPLLIPCTPEQVEVLESFNTYKNVTNISSDSIGELEVFYYKDLETLLGGV